MLFIKNEDIMSVPEFLQSCEVERELALRDMNLTMLDKTINHIKKNKYKYLLLVLLLATTIDFSTIQVFAVDTATIDKAGLEILSLIRKVAYWVAIICCAKDVVKLSMRGQLENIGSIVMMYLMGFGVLYFLPWAFDLIKGLF